MSRIATRSPTEVAKIIFQRLTEHDLDAAAEFVNADVDEYWPVAGRLNGAGAVREHFAAIFAAMPDFKIDVERMAADGETVLREQFHRLRRDVITH